MDGWGWSCGMELVMEFRTKFTVDRSKAVFLVMDVAVATHAQIDDDVL